jgi:hypothetical protein
MGRGPVWEYDEVGVQGGWGAVNDCQAWSCASMRPDAKGGVAGGSEPGSRQGWSEKRRRVGGGDGRRARGRGADLGEAFLEHFLPRLRPILKSTPHDSAGTNS